MNGTLIVLHQCRWPEEISCFATAGGETGYTISGGWQSIFNHENTSEEIAHGHCNTLVPVMEQMSSTRGWHAPLAVVAIGRNAPHKSHHWQTWSQQCIWHTIYIEAVRENAGLRPLCKLLSELNMLSTINHIIVCLSYGILPQPKQAFPASSAVDLVTPTQHCQ